MKIKGLKYFIVTTITLFGIGLYSLGADLFLPNGSLWDAELSFPVMEEDSLPPARYPVAKTAPQEYQDILKQSPADLRDPENVQTSIEYDLKTGSYIVRTRIGDMEIGTPMTLTPEEYQDYSMQQSLRSYFRQKNEEEFLREASKEFNIADMQFDIGAAEKVFGPGGVRVRTQGSADITLGLKSNTTKNPSLPARSRSRTFFNFDESVQLNVQANVGTKVKFDMNYNTETSFDFDSKKLKLAYTGEEDEIIRSLEAGNVSMTTSNSLIRGGTALFGMKADLQFGKLRVNALFAQQESESRTVSSKGGAQTREFEITADQYDENRHFFLAHYFRDNYDQALEKLPYIKSGIEIKRIEVWVTNIRQNYDQPRNIVAFSDLAEGQRRHIGNPTFVSPNPAYANVPQTKANNLYETIINNYPNARDRSLVYSTLRDAGLEESRDFEKIEQARLLDASEYKLNSKLGYISLNSQLQANEVLAVAYEFTYAGKNYQVGEFSVDNTEETQTNLYVKLLKGTALTPDMPFWDLMMKNVYSLGAYSVQKEKFRLDILYQSDTTGTYLNYIPEGQIKDQILLRVMNLDRLDSNQNANPDGFYDFIDGYTILADNGRVIFPVVEPFGSHLRSKIGNDVIADKYVYQELYDTTLTVARQTAEKNKFILRGEYKASSGSEIQLGATNVARGSVRVTAGAVELTENVDYTVDYTSGIVTILNENIISSGSTINVSLENQSVYNMQRKTMVGVDLNYQFTPDFMIGGTVMHLSEMPLTTKTSFGDEALKNTLWGLNMSYRTESQWLTNMVSKLPLLTLTKPSQISFNAEFAHLIAGHYENKYTGGYSYLDDFESSTSGIDLLNPYPWVLASTPTDNPRFPEATRSDDVLYGRNRALLAWYYIDGIFTRKSSSLRPSHLTPEDLSNHYVRGVNVTELFPARQQVFNEDNTLQVLNLAYYPNERGPYNLNAAEMDSEGYLMYPEKRWGGIMRKIDQTDFETANIEYIQFWLMDPFIYNANTATGGDLYFNLGDISEDILKDGKKFFENGLPIDGDESKVEYTVWGKVPKQQSTVYAFDNSSGARAIQDVGLNGLSSEEEKTYGAYEAFLREAESKLSPEARVRLEADPFSFLNDPGGDDFHHYRGSDYDRDEVDILTRYKRYNGTEGNSVAQEESGESYSTAAKSLPDVEDINQDSNLNETERYYEYQISLRPEDMTIGRNYITDTLSATVTLAKGGPPETIKWYQFKIPVKQPKRAVGRISDFKSIRFMRMYLTDFAEPVVLRFGTFQLIRGEWRVYEQNLFANDAIISQKGNIEVATVNIEENSKRSPIPYVLPPGVSRALDPSQPQLRQENEQSLSLKVTQLAAQDARAIYKNTHYDLRQYKRLQLFTHGERFLEGQENYTDLRDGDLSVFIRLGSDYKNNYYEYEVPLTLTSHEGVHNSETVWPIENMLNFRFEVLTDLKLKRNRVKNEGIRDVNFTTLYSEYDPDNPRNTISVIGNPSLAEVKVLMIGVRNNSGATRSGEVWVNELRLTDFEEDGGWAANANLNVALSDLGTVSLAGRVETAGFGGLDQSMAERRLDDFTQYSVATNVELGKFFPEKAQVSIPFYYAYSKEVSSPKYNPLDQDIKLKDALNELDTKAERDSLKNLSQERSVTKGIAFNNIRVNIRSKNPMPYDPANFSFGYSYSEIKNTAPETAYETTKDYRGNFAYSYTPYARPFRPFQSLKKNNGYTKYPKQFSLNYLPSNISFQTAILRNYYEIQLRDLSSAGVQNGLLSFSQNFYWDRAFSMRWDLTNSLSVSFTSGTNARIEEPYMQVNKQLNPDQYQVWKDSVKQSIRDLGTPMKYDQSFTVTWNAPLQYIPVLDWISSSTTYNAMYNWDRGATIDEDIEIGNTIRNQRQLNIQGNLNFLNLYNKNNYLKKINQKFNPTARNTARNQTKRPPKSLEKEVQLNRDSGTIVQHGMLTKKVVVVAKDENGKRYPVKFKAINYGQIMITNKDSVKLNLVLTPGLTRSEDFLTKTAEYSTRFLMSLRRVNIQYGITDGMYITGFRPEIGDIFGQGQTSHGYAPGVGFAFGSVSRRYIDKALERNWLVTDSTIENAILNSARTLTIQANLEPLYGLKIDLTGNRIDTRNTDINFVYEGIRDIQGGSFSMSTVAIRTAFKGSGNAANGYNSKAFNKFLENRAVIAQRLENKYAGTSYPYTSFLSDQYRGQPYNPENGAVSQNSADVLIPAFLAAYTGKDPKKSGLSAFPSLSSLIPNWRITYDGLIRVPGIKKHFKSFVLSHQYRATYNVGSYSSYVNWAGEGDLGFRLDVQTEAPVPSMPYEISSVSITESFSPLLGADATLLNNVTVRADYTTTRNLNLNITSFQIVEALSNRITLGLGYKITEFNKILNMRPSRNFSNDLNVRVDFSHTKMQSLIRKIEDAFTQATSGNIAKTIQLSADYGISRALTLRAFYDLQINDPIITSTSYPTSNSSYGVSVRFSLAQ